MKIQDIVVIPLGVFGKEIIKDIVLNDNVKIVYSDELKDLNYNIVAIYYFIC